MNVLTIHAQFRLSDEFVGDVPGALRELATYLESPASTTSQKPAIEALDRCQGAMEPHFREALARGRRSFGKATIGTLTEGEVAPEEPMQIEVDVSPT
jgi:hypothetical protein